MKPVDLKGKRFNKLLVLNFVDRNKFGLSNWLCLCDCGKNKIVNYANIVTGHTKSCGCLKIDTNTKHGNSSSKTYRSYLKAKSRCYNPNNINYKNYGGVGVTMCDRWLESFENFYLDMGDRPDGKTLNRKINLLTSQPFKTYSKFTCDWADNRRQNIEKSKSKNNKSGRTGVRFRSDRSAWVATMRINDKQTQLYYGKCFEDAVTAIESAELEHYCYIRK